MDDLLGPFSGSHILNNLSTLLINQNYDSLIASTPLLASSKLTDCDTKKFWIIICSLKYLETFPETRYRVLYDLSEALCKISKPEQITEAVMQCCEQFRSAVSLESYGHALFMSEIVLKLITETVCLPDEIIVSSKISNLSIWDHKNNKHTSAVFKNLTVSHGLIEIRMNKIPIIFISKIINNLEPEIMVATLCSLNTFLFKTIDSSALTVMYDSVTFWKKILTALQSPDENMTRKRALFMIQIILSHLTERQESISCKDGRGELLFHYKPGLEAMWETILLINETLEETQSHIIKPIFSLIPGVCDYIREGKLGLPWLVLIFSRILNQESKMIARWGVQLLLELDHKLFIGPNIDYLFQVLFPALTKTSMFYRPNFLIKGSFPPILKKLMLFIQNIASALPEAELSEFLARYLNFFNHCKRGSVPLVMMSFVLSNLNMSPVLSVQHVEVMTKVHRSVIHTHPHAVKGAVQCFFTISLLNHAQLERAMVRPVLDYLGSLYLEYTISTEVALWQQMRAVLVPFIMREMEYFSTLVRDLYSVTESTASVKGVAIALLLLSEVESLSVDIVDVITQPLARCGENLYLPEHHTITSAQLITTVSALASKAHPISTQLMPYSEGIIESCLQFLDRYIALSLMLSEEGKEIKARLGNITALSKTIGFFSGLQQGKVNTVTDAVIACLETLNRLKCDLSALNSSDTDVCVATVIKLACLLEYSDTTHPINNLFLSISSPTQLSKSYSAEVFHSFLEAAWLCVTASDTSNVSPMFLYTRAIEDIQKMKSHHVTVRMVQVAQGVLEAVISEDLSVFSDSLRGLWVCVEDHENSSVYWEILEAFCDIAFHHSVLTSAVCSEVVEKWLSKLERLGSEKEGAMFYVCQALTKNNDVSRASTFWDYSHFYVTKLNLYGICQTREKKNSDDLIAFIRALGEGCAVNMVYPEVRRDAGKVRAMAATFILAAVTDNTTLCDHVVQILLDINNGYTKGYLMNSMPNRLKIRLWQTILLISPQLTQSPDLAQTFRQILECLRSDEQPSVRCYIEWCCCLILIRKRDLMSIVWDHLTNYQTRSNSLLTSLCSIVHHTVAALSYTDCLTEEWLNTSMAHVTTWTNCQNHSVRNYASASVVKLELFYHKHNYALPGQFSAQIQFLVSNTDVAKILARIEANHYFSKFNVVRDCCLRNIFTTIPAQFCILENEWIGEDQFSQCEDLWMPRQRGDFHLLEYPVSHEEDSYLISFTDLQSSSNVQKKITPWQTMASNLGLELDRRGRGELVVFASLIEKAPNLGGLSRTCEIFNAHSMVVNNREVLLNREFKSLSMTSEKWVQFTEVNADNSAEYFLSKKREGYTIVGVEQTAKSVSLESFTFPEKSVLVLGRERDGIPVGLMDAVDVCVEIPQFGVIRSLNVHVSAAIMVWEYAKQHSVKQK